MALLPPRHPLAGTGPIVLADLAEAIWVAPSREGLIVRACEAAGFTPSIRYVSRDPLANRGLVAAGLAVTISPAGLAAEFSGIAVETVRDAPTRSVYALLPASGATPPARDFAAALGPAHHHAQHHLRPVLGVRAARAGVDGHERVARVVLAGEQALLLECRQARLDGGEGLLELGREVLVLLGDLGQALEVVRVGLQLRERVELALRARMLGARPGRRVLVVPEPRRPHLRLERAEAPLQRSGVKGSPRAGTLARGWRPAAAAWAVMRMGRPWL